MIIVRSATAQDWAQWLSMRTDLWPECPRDKHLKEMELILNTSGCNGRILKTDVLVCDDGKGYLLGFAELSLRASLEGFITSPIAYLEGWYVLKDYRGKGIGKKLIWAVENWALELGCTELASDSEPENHISIEAHKKLGFTEYGFNSEGVLFRKVIG